jgi:Flp pilus assembly protein CpaB
MSRSLHPPGARARWWAHRHPIVTRLLPALAVALVLGPLRSSPPGDGLHPPVLVAARDLAVGATITAADLERAPVRVAGGTAAPDAVGRVVVHPVLDGEPIVEERLAPDGLEGTAALIPPGQRAIAVPIALAVPPVAVGDHVDVVTTDELGRASVVRDALVVATTDAALSVAVDADDAAHLAGALATGAVTVALAGAEP